MNQSDLLKLIAGLLSAILIGLAILDGTVLGVLHGGFQIVSPE